MPTIIEMSRLGEPEVLVAREVPAEPLKDGELRLRHTVVGFNYLDVYLRKGVYGVPLPCVLGIEATGRVIELGKGVRGVKVGDRVAYTNELGAYATERTLDASRAIALPDDVSDEDAAALLFKGQTAHMLLRRVYKVGKGDAILVHAAAGGVGLVLVRWAKALGAAVIGTVGSQDKVVLARSNGCDHVAVLGQDDVASFVREVTGGGWRAGRVRLDWPRHVRGQHEEPGSVRRDGILWPGVRRNRPHRTAASQPVWFAALHPRECRLAHRGHAHLS
ncbi:zinc-binding dehydrogenase [Ensifer psoraleae]|uniref:Zinc-binding dehydrogenase n=1 Tax=Sinorhizobium psoraleae TaxID=520838 RepID=A0ABT4KBA8_9HYPH|nr:zinc-binding dehydrogenase [Sinorhizobium psoraleae]MCZ4089253.1 zinc-binding dehydrogenase [Sinorhizobium psoraleae]